MQIVKILLPCLVFAACLNTNKIQKEQSFSNIEQKIYKSKSGFQYLTLKALEEENGLYHPVSFRINGIWLHHFKKNPLVLEVSEGSFDIKVSSVSKLPTFIEDLYISSGDSVVLDIKLENDLSPLYD